MAVDVGLWFCPRCLEERLFRSWEEPYDENLAECVSCGYSFGYVVEAGAEQLPDGSMRPTAKPRPVLDPAVLREGMLKYRAFVTAQLEKTHSVAVAVATKQLRDGLETTNRDDRARRLGAKLPGKPAA